MLYNIGFYYESELGPKSFVVRKKLVGLWQTGVELNLEFISFLSCHKFCREREREREKVIWVEVCFRKTSFCMITLS